MSNYKLKNSDGIVFDTNGKGIGLPQIDNINNATTSGIQAGSLMYAIAQNSIYYFNGTAWISGQGTSGTSGVNGSSGSSGTAGSSGSTGTSGSSGSTGSSGSSGSTGTSGSSGSTGSSGSSGSTGTSGSAGSSGSTGTSGSSGTSGTAGTAGSSGSSGSSGISMTFKGTYSAGTTYAANDVVYHNGSSYVSLLGGNVGNTPNSSPSQWSLAALAGTNGTSGTSGSSGSSGSSGHSGASGSSGSSGSSGQNGSSGSSGQSGTAGSSGSSGSSGQSGAPGSSGSSGSSGQSGAAGSSGSSGTSGTRGSSGSSGSSGQTGVAGSSGSSGSSGQSGAAGSSGSSGQTGAAGSSGSSGSSGAGTISGTTNYIAKFTNSTTVGNSQIFDNGTTIGIGTTTPTSGSRFEISGSGVWDGAVITLTNTGTSGRSWSIFSTNTSFSQGGGKFLLYNTTAGTDAFVVDSSNNFGIGTTSPGQKLHVAGFTRTHGISLNDGAVAGFIGYEKSWLGSGSNDVAIASEGGNNIRFYTNGTTSVRMMVNTSGNVGINTTSPQSLLNVNLGAGNSTYGTPAIWVGGTSNYDSLTLGIKGGYDAFIATYGNDLHIYSGNFKSTATATENHNIHFYTSQNGSTNWNTAKMFLQYDGNFGVGTTSPSARIQAYKDGGNGSGGLGDFGVVVTSTSSSGTYQATIGAMNIQAGGYANLNLGDSDGISGTRYFWHISKRLTSANELGSGARNLSYYWYDGSGFSIKFAFGTGGSFYASSDVVAYASSDIRLKENITRIDSALKNISQLNGYRFTWNDKQTTYKVGKRDIGVIAQEVEKYFPEIVKDRENGTKGVMYEKFVPILIEAIKELSTENQELKARLELIEAKIKD